MISTLTGTASGDHVGGAVDVLANGSFVAYSPGWDNGSAVDAGAVMWGNGSTGVGGVVSAANVGPANSLVGAKDHDRVGSDGVVV